MAQPGESNRVLDYASTHERVSGLAVVAAVVSILALPVSILLPIATHTGAMRQPSAIAEVVSNWLKTVLPLFFAQILANRSLVVVLRSHRTSKPLRGLNYAIAAVIFSSAWIILLAVANL